MSSWDLGALWDRGIVVLIAVVGYVWRIEKRLSADRADIEMLKAQRREDQSRIDKALDEIKADIRGMRADLKDYFTQ